VSLCQEKSGKKEEPVLCIHLVMGHSHLSDLYTGSSDDLSPHVDSVVISATDYISYDLYFDHSQASEFTEAHIRAYTRVDGPSLEYESRRSNASGSYTESPSRGTNHSIFLFISNTSI
jgi:hypothetical protein